MDHAVSLGLKLALDEVAIQKYTIPTWGQFFFFLPKRRKRERGEGGGEREEGGRGREWHDDDTGTSVSGLTVARGTYRSHYRTPV